MYTVLQWEQITSEQEQALIKAFKDGPDELQSNGIKVGDEKYMFLRPVDNSFYGKKGVRPTTPSSQSYKEHY